MSVAAAGKAKNRGVLFAQVYIDSILAKLKDANESSLLETLKEWFAKADKSSLGNYVSSFVGPVLDVQGFVRGALSGNIVFLFEDRNLAKRLSLCYVVNSDESLDQTVKGKNYAVSLVKALKKAGLRWGILTNGNIWRRIMLRKKRRSRLFFRLTLEELWKTGIRPRLLFLHTFSMFNHLYLIKKVSVVSKRIDKSLMKLQSRLKSISKAKWRTYSARFVWGSFSQRERNSIPKRRSVMSSIIPFTYFTAFFSFCMPRQEDS